MKTKITVIVELPRAPSPGGYQWSVKCPEISYHAYGSAETAKEARHWCRTAALCIITEAGR